MVSVLQKNKIVNMLQLIDNQKILKHIEQMLQKELQEVAKTKKPDVLQELMLQEMVKPMRKTITVEQLKKEQDYQPFSIKEYEEMVVELDIQEDVDDLLKMLTK